MSNMSYCRFENTYDDLRDCFNHMNDELSKDEEIYKQKIIKLCHAIVENNPEDDE